MPLTPQQRSAAAYKAAATKRRNAAAAAAAGAGPARSARPSYAAPPPPPRPSTPPPSAGSGQGQWKTITSQASPIFGKPQPTVRELQLEVIAALIDLFAFKRNGGSGTPEDNDSFERVKKVLALGIGSTTQRADVTTQNEQAAALRRAAIELTKLAF